MSVNALDTASMSYPRSSSPCCESPMDEMIDSTPEAFCTTSIENLCSNDSGMKAIDFDIENHNMGNLTSNAAEIDSVESSNLSFQSCDDSMEDIFKSVYLGTSYTAEKMDEIVLDMEEYEPYTLPLPPTGSYYTTVFFEEQDMSFLEEDSGSQAIDDVVVDIPQTTTEESLTPSGGRFGKVVIGAVISVITLLLTGFAIYRFAT